MHRSAPVITPARTSRGRRRRIIPLIIAVASAGALLMPAGTAGAVTVADQWGGTSADGGNTGTNPGERVVTASSASKLRAAWATGATTTGPYPPAVLGGVVYGIGSVTSGGSSSPQFTASSPRTGATLWRVTLPVSEARYGYGLAASGHTVVAAFSGNPGGLIAVDISTRRIAWRATFPASTINGIDSSTPGLPVTDGSRVYVPGSSNVLNAYSLTTGARLWTVPVTLRAGGGLNGVDGIAAGGGVVYASGNVLGGLGLVAYSATTGKRLWASASQQAYRPPVVAAGKVFVSTIAGVAAYPAAGCGSASCSPSWTRTIPSYDVGGQSIAAADGTTVFVTSRVAVTGTATCDIRFQGTVTRLSASTGAVQWRTSVGESANGLVRGGDAVWVLNEYRSTANGCAEQDRILGYSASQTGSSPIASIALPSRYWGFPQTLAVASGTLFESTSAFVGYRIPGS